MNLERDDPIGEPPLTIGANSRSPAPPPAPHPLDFDWRYDEATAKALADLVCRLGPIVTIGSPTVARLLEATGIDVTLVDRQPLQGVHHHIKCDAASFTADRNYRAALVDPPWYPAQLTTWTETAARAVGPGGTVFVSVWPSVTRPSAISELTHAFKRFSEWAEISRHTATLHYLMPQFETLARRYAATAELSTSPLIGELVRLDINTAPPVTSAGTASDEWLRFTIDNYQLAIRKRSGLGPVKMEPVASAIGWRWPYVSARAPRIDQIDLWSSDGEVATLGSSQRLIDILRQALRAPDAKGFERALIGEPALLAWSIPRPPYRRLIEWHHQQ